MKKRNALIIILTVITFVMLFRGASQAAITASPPTATVGQLVTFTVTGCCNTACLGYFNMNFGDSQTGVTTSNCISGCPTNCAGATATHVYASPGTYAVTATPYTTGIMIGGGTTSVTVNPPGPTVTASPNPATQGQPVNFSLVFPLSAIPCLNLGFDYGDSTTTFIACNSTPCVPPSHSYAAGGTYIASARGGTCGANGSTTVSVVACPPLTATAQTPPAGSTGQPFSYQVLSTGGQSPVRYSYFSGVIPPGLTLSSTGLLSGVPTTAGYFYASNPLTVRATDSCLTPQAVSIPVSLTVNCSPINFISTSPLASTVTGQTYSYPLQSSGGQAPINYTLIAGALPGGMTLQGNGLLSGTPTTEGNYSLTVAASSVCYPPGPQTTRRTFALTVQCPPLSITSAPTLPGTTVGLTYYYRLIYGGGRIPYTVSMTSGSLPPGLSLSAGGVITGTPTTAGTYSFTVNIADSCAIGAQNARNTFTITVSPASPVCQPLAFTTAALPAATATQAYTYQILSSGGQAPYAFTLVSGSLPPGITLSSSGLLSGSPTTAGSYSFAVNLADSCPAGIQHIQKAFSLTVSPAPPPSCPLLAITTSSLPSGTANQLYSSQLLYSGGQGPYTFTLASGSLPSGLTLSPAGLITGTPIAAGSYSFIVNLADSCPGGSQNVQKAFSMAMAENPEKNIVMSVSPSSFRVARNTAATGNVSYIFSATPSLNATLQSSKGFFLAGGTVVGEINTPLSVTLINGSGIATESVFIPVAIAERAEQLGLTRITLTRTFSNANVSLTGEIAITVTTEAGADFRVTRLQIYFENRTAEITLRRNEPLKAYIDISFSGSGLLQGYWEADGRIISQVFRNLVFGEIVTIETPAIPPLPTYDPGVHILRFVITSPVIDFEVPEAIYFVTSEESAKMRTIKLISPKDGAEVNYSPLTLTWEGVGPASVYLLEFLEEGGIKPVFSAYSRKTDYLVPESALKSVFSPGRNYSWTVKGLDISGNAVGESRPYSFSIKEVSSYLPGQIVVVVNSSEAGTKLIEGIIGRYDLRLIDDFDIRSVHLRMVVLQTKEDIFKFIGPISKEEGVIHVQPNYIFGTLAEQSSEARNIPGPLNLKKIHQSYTGKGVIVAVIDTGVDSQHKDLKGKVIDTENLVKDSSFAAEIHGTAVAGIIGAGTEGIAPAAELIALRACRQISGTQPEGECYTTSVVKAIDVAIAKKAKIVNMSFGTASHDMIITKLIDEGARRKTIFVAAAGNTPQQRDLRFPASLPSVLSVGGIDDKGRPFPNKELASKSKVCAPAVNILTTIPGDKYNFLSGTSMSSAEVSGLLALAAEKNSGLEFSDIPPFKGDVCKWEEELLNLSLCNK